MEVTFDLAMCRGVPSSLEGNTESEAGGLPSSWEESEAGGFPSSLEGNTHRPTRSDTNSERKDAKKASSELETEGPQAGVCMGHSCRRQLQVRDFLGPGLP